MLPALGAFVFLAILVIGTAWWVFRSDARTERVGRVPLAWRGNAGCLPHADAAAAQGRPTRQRRLPGPRHRDRLGTGPPGYSILALMG